ncbi:MAG TPA: hypothetical protein VF060_23760 [Trebonia sp.]
MSFTDRLILWLHIGVAIFTIGPATAAIMSTPRYIRKHDTAVVGFLRRITRVYTIASLLVFVFGLVLADMRNDFSKPWISISMTLFVVALVLLVLIIRDQGAAVATLEREAAALAPRTSAVVQAEHPEAGTASAGAGGGSAKPGDAQTAQGSPADSATPGATTAVGTADTLSIASAPAATAANAEQIAAVERGRIASLGGVTSLIWLVILILMVWR